MSCHERKQLLLASLHIMPGDKTAIVTDIHEYAQSLYWEETPKYHLLRSTQPFSFLGNTTNNVSHTRFKAQWFVSTLLCLPGNLPYVVKRRQLKLKLHWSNLTVVAAQVGMHDVKNIATDRHLFPLSSESDSDDDDIAVTAAVFRWRQICLQVDDKDCKDCEFEMNTNLRLWKCCSPIHGFGTPLGESPQQEPGSRGLHPCRPWNEQWYDGLHFYRLSTERFSALHDLRGGMGVQRWEDVPTHFVNVNY